MRLSIILSVFITTVFVKADLLPIIRSIPLGDKVQNKGIENYRPYPENRVHRAGILWMNITNCGYIGNIHFAGDISDNFDPCTGDLAPSGEMPGGSGKEYLYISSLVFGGYIDSADVIINDKNGTLFQGPLVSTGWEGSTTILGAELQPYYFDADPQGLDLGRISEISSIEGRMNCLFQDVYDPKATAYEQFISRFTDKGTDHQTWDNFELREHIPIGIEVRQVSYAWPYDFAKKIIIIDYTLYNKNEEKKDIYNFFMGMHIDPDVGRTYYGRHADDICGFIEKWDNYIDPATGIKKSVDMNIIWTADNDGREYELGGVGGWYIDSEPGAGSILDGAEGVFSVRVLRNPNPNLNYSFNISTAGTYESEDWGPRWKTGLHSDWQFDLTRQQKGYDDTNYDNLDWWYEPLYGGRTEGTPVGDKGRYMVMSNGEFDYNLTSIREIYLDMDTQADGTPIPQFDKWQKWTTAEDIGNEGFSTDIPDGTIRDLNDIANGYESRFLLSFGPLGYESYVNLAIDSNGDSLGIPDDVINKKVWKFAYGDSLKLTLAFMVSENFHTSLNQDPNYRDSSIVDLSDGLDISLYDQGWYDAFHNVVWAERVFDTPMFDTPVKKWGTTKKDGWYGEDVGADAMFGYLMSDPYCWWIESSYSGPDTGEGDSEITTFTNPIIDIYGEVATNEDNLLPFGRKEWSGDYGPTGNSGDGEGYGYMVKYDKLDGSAPQWVRYGYGNEKLDAGDGVPDFTSPPPPPSPKITVTEVDNDVIVEWCSHEFYTGDDGGVGVAGPEHTYDPYTRLYDFEGYHIELSPDRQSNNFTTIFSIDKVNYSYQNVADPKDYYDNPIPSDSIYAHQGDYPPIITANGKTYRLVSYGDNRDMTMDHSVPEMFSYSCTIEPSPYTGWDSIRKYRFVLHNQTLAQQKFIAVTASDFGAPKMGVPAIKSSPESNATASVTANLTTTDKVVIVPNPYRGDVKYTDMGWENLDGDYAYDEGYRKIAFLNIPERCVIKIYTLAGDLVKVIAHNGNSKWSTMYWYGKNGAYWNLINDNQQAAMSGIYLFSVQDADKKKDDFVGKFVIIK